MIFKGENEVLGQEEVCHYGAVHQKFRLLWSGFNPSLSVTSCAMTRPQDADVLRVQSDRTYDGSAADIKHRLCTWMLPWSDFLLPPRSR
jgi:hypothetical protein